MTHVTHILIVLILLAASGSAVVAVTAESTQDYYWLIFMRPPNAPPVIDPDVDMAFMWPSDSVRLDALVTDYPADTLSHEWTQLSGPAEVVFKDIVNEDITAVFPRYGDYLLQLSVSDGEFTSTIQVSVPFNFLGNYMNPDQHKLPADRVYPKGQKMMITAWLAKSEEDLQKMKDHGFTMQGPIWDTGYDDGDIFYLNTASNKGLRAAHRLYTGSISKDASSLANALKDAQKRTAIVNRMKTEILRVIENPVFDSVVDVWLTGCEELSTRGSDCDLNTSGSPSCEVWDPVYNEKWYLNKFQEAVRKYDPQKRPLWMSDVIGTDTKQFLPTHRYLDMLGPQMYLERINPDGDGYTHNGVVRGLVADALLAGRLLDINVPVLRPRPVTVSFGAHFEPIPSRDNQVFIDKHTEHDLYLALNSGLQGFQIYSWHNYPSNDTDTWNWYKDAYYKHVKTLTDYQLDYAYLWGDRRNDLTIKIVNGPKLSKGQPSISSANIQYGDNRFLILTNSAEEVVQISIENIPKKCAKVLDIRESLYLPKASSVNTTMQPLDVRLYRFDEDGDC